MRLTAVLLVIAGLQVSPAVADMPHPALRSPAPWGSPARQEGSIAGRVVDASTGAPVSNVEIRILELGRSELSHSDGSFHFLDISPRLYTISAQRIGFATIERKVLVREEQTLALTLEMMQSALELPGVVVTGTGRARVVGDTYQPTAVVEDAELGRRLEGTVAATIAHLPGVSERFNGPGASQPVIRGMSGERILILEDGLRTGDLSASAPDHAVLIDPISAERIEVVRGPAGLMYGSNALGGVINVVREEIPRTLPDNVSGSINMQGESVSSGLAGGGSLLVPLGRMVARGELSIRSAGDIQTPEAVLGSSGIRSHSGSLGVSRIEKWGFFGASVRDSELEYEVPSQLPGIVIPGAHPAGVEIQSRRRAGRVELARYLGYGPISSITFDGNLVSVEHRELEGRAGSRPIVGTRFQNRFGSANLVMRHEHQLDPVFAEGAVGFYASGRDLVTRGTLSGSRDASAIAGAAFAYEELGIDPFRIQLGARYDWTRISPRDRSTIETGKDVLTVANRTFGAFSGSASAMFEPMQGVMLGGSLARAFRNPSVEELFAKGPHLADFSFEVGSPDLEPEIGVGTELFIRIARPRLRAEADLFRNHIADYIHYVPTTQADPLYHRFPVFTARAADVAFEGAEGSLQWEAIRRWVVDGSIAYIRATRLDDGDALPSIPPLNGSLGLRYESEGYFFHGMWDATGSQTRLPRPFEVATDFDPVDPEVVTPGYNLFGIGAGIRWNVRGAMHSVTLQVDNLTDVGYREHISPLRNVSLQRGRNVQMLYRLQF